MILRYYGKLTFGYLNEIPNTCLVDYETVFCRFFPPLNLVEALNFKCWSKVYLEDLLFIFFVMATIFCQLTKV